MLNTVFSKVAIASIAATAFVGVFASASRAANLGGYTFEGSNGNPSGVATGLTFTNFTYVGTGTTNFPAGYNPGPGPSGKSFSSDNFSTDSAINPNNSAADGYFQFGITAAAGYTFNLSDLSFATKRNGDASPTGIQVRSSVNNFAAFIGGSDQALGRKNVWTPYSTSLGFNNLTSIMLRLYPYGGNNGRAENLDIDSVAVQGSVARTAVPTPALLPGLVGLGAGLLRKRKQAALQG